MFKLRHPMKVKDEELVKVYQHAWTFTVFLTKIMDSLQIFTNSRVKLHKCTSFEFDSIFLRLLIIKFNNFLNSSEKFY